MTHAPQPPDPGRRAGIELHFPRSPGPDTIDCGDQPMFDGDVRARVARQAEAPGQQTVMATRFAAGASTVWHSHDADQTLVVVDGSGRLEYDADHVELGPGDVTTVPAGVRHRHRSDHAASMTHLSVTGHGDSHLHT
jgi:quercetin dioxygenase-like cupin family protein